MKTHAPLPPIHRYHCRLIFKRPSSFRFLHGGALMGALCSALDWHPLPDRLIPCAGESGRVAFGPGDVYGFGLTCVGPPEDFANRLEVGLRRLGCAHTAGGAPPPALGGNFTLDAVSRLPAADPLRHPAVLRGSDTVTLRFLSPLRMYRPRELDRPGERYLNGSCFPAAHFLDRLGARVRALTGQAHQVDGSENLRSETDLLWLDMPIRGNDAPDRGRPKGYTIGGVVGTVTLSGLSPAHLQLLALGELLHVGEKTHYGFGRFVIEDDWNPGNDPFGPVVPLRARMADAGVLSAALRHVVENSVAAGVDHVAPADIASDHLNLTTHLSRDLGSGTYVSAELRGFLIPKTNGGVRPLAVPTVRDRCAQRAAVDLLSPAVETLLENCSFGYRKGLSRTHAARAIQRAWDDGYRYVLDADIESFFDSVTWPRMLAKFRALFPYSGIIDLITAWLDRPVLYEGRRITRTRGLPQGSPISPLLANLFLDEFDEELLGRGFRLVRYADDFVVLCRTLEEAERARDQSRAVLAELGLNLNEDKTRVTGFD